MFLVKADDLHRGSSYKVKIICDNCECIFEREYYKYINSIEKNSVSYCHDCVGALRNFNSKQTTLSARQDSLYNRLIEKSLENGYEIVSDKDVIKRNTSIIDYICKKHGLHHMRVSNFLNGKGCPQCHYEKARENYQLSVEEVKRRIDEAGGKILNPEEYINNSSDNLVFECTKCGNHFNSSLQHFLQHGNRVCSECYNKESNGERKIREYLEKHSINFNQEYWFSDCRDIKPLPFDFYLPDENICIEFDGEQHYNQKGYFHHSVEQVNSHDNIKTNYCASHNIHLIRIPYWEYNNIENILKENIHTKI